MDVVTMGSRSESDGRLTRVGFVSVRSTISRPSARSRVTSLWTWFSERSQRVRLENTLETLAPTGAVDRGGERERAAKRKAGARCGHGARVRRERRVAYPRIDRDGDILRVADGCSVVEDAHPHSGSARSFSR